MEAFNILRVISGTAKGHKLKTLKGDNTRPTSDRVKESLFNIITSYINEADVLDLYAGTGNLGIEALSRGAKSATFIEKNHECIKIIKENLEHTKLIDKAFLIEGEVNNSIIKLGIEKKKFHLILLDPPYNKNLILVTLKNIINSDIIDRDCLIVAERDIADDLPEEVGKLKLTRNQKYGDTIISFFQIES